MSKLAAESDLEKAIICHLTSPEGDGVTGLQLRKKVD